MGRQAIIRYAELLRSARHRVAVPVAEISASSGESGFKIFL
jgi:hypothetical protein